MKPKDLFLGFCVAALLVSELFLFLANRQKVAALNEARAAKQQVEKLRAELEQFKNSDAAAQSAELVRLRADNMDLPRLRNDIRRLTGTNQQLTQQLEAAHAVTEQQQQQLQQLEAENKELREPPPVSVAQADAERNACFNNLRQIDAAKQQWALENNKSAYAVPTAQDLSLYLPGGVFPVCPSGGIYSINAVGVPPTCSTHGQVPAQ